MATALGHSARHGGDDGRPSRRDAGRASTGPAPDRHGPTTSTRVACHGHARRVATTHPAHGRHGCTVGHERVSNTERRGRGGGAQYRSTTIARDTVGTFVERTFDGAVRA